MRHFKQYSISLGLMLLAALPIQAQQENGAFYIYQNDGHFDGFFYDQVQKISYSTLDTLGIEHDDFVSQEIITADSTYRIMLSAIDSVGFVQPEIKYNPRLRVMEDEGMLKYSLGHNKQTLVFQGLPEDKIPQVDDVLVTYDFRNMFFPNGFGGKVNRVQKQGSYLYVYTDSLSDFTDIFQQFITVEDFGYDQQTKQLTSRRMAGVKGVPRRGDNEETTLFKFAINPHVSWVTGNFTASGDLSVGIECRAKAVYNFSFWGEKYFKIDLKEKVETGISATLDIQIPTPWEAETKMNSIAPILLPATAPILRLMMIPEGFIRSQIHATAQASTRKLTFRAGQSIEFKNWSFNGSMSFGNNARFDDEEENADPGPLIQLSGSINGFVQVGVKWPFIIRTNDFFKKVLDAEVGMNVWAGPKLSGEVNINVNDFASSAISGNPTKLYNTFKDSKLSFNPFIIDYEMKSLVKYLSYKGDTLTIADGSVDWTSYDWYVFPTFENPTILPGKPLYGPGNYRGDPTAHYTAGSYGTKIIANIKPRRNVLKALAIGAAVFKGDSLVDKFMGSEAIGQSGHNPLYTSEKTYDTDTTRWRGASPAAYGPVAFPVDGMANADLRAKPGTYKIYPMISIFEKEIICEPATTITIPGMFINMDSRYENISAPGDRTSETEIVVNTNADLNIRHYEDRPVHYGNSDVWLKKGNVGWIDSYDKKFYAYDQLERHMLGLPDTICVKIGRNPEMLPLETNIPIVASGYNDMGKEDTLTVIAVIKQPAFNIYDKVGGYFNQNMTCTSGPAKGANINLNLGWNNIPTAIASSRSGNIVSCTGVQGVVTLNGWSAIGEASYELSYKCDVVQAQVTSGTVILRWQQGDDDPINCKLEYDIHGFNSEDGKPSPYYCTYEGRPKRCTYTEQGEDGSGKSWTNVYTLASENGSVHMTFNPRDLTDVPEQE